MGNDLIVISLVNNINVMGSNLIVISLVLSPFDQYLSWSVAYISPLSEYLTTRYPSLCVRTRSKVAAICGRKIAETGD